MSRSRFSSTSSVTTKSRSKRERSESGRAMFLWGSLWMSYYSVLALGLDIIERECVLLTWP